MAIQDYASILLGVMWTQVVVAFVFIGLRMYTRYFLIRSVGLDDIIMIVNLFFFVGYVLCTTIGIHYGIGKKYAAVEPSSYSKAIMWEAIGQGICILGIAASKGSVAIFLLRIVIRKWHVWLLWFCILSTTILCIITTTLLFLQCKPTAFLWDHTIEGGVCWLNFTNVGLSMGAWSTFMDFVLAILPWHVVMGLNMKRKEKLTVAFGLSLGIFAGICSIIRTYELQALSSLNEYVYDTVPMLLWSSTEVLATIVCACIPVLRPLYVRLKYGSKGSSSGRSYPMHDYSKSGKKSSGGFPSIKGRSRGGGDGTGSGKSDDRIYMGPGASVLATTVKMGSDNASEESILREMNQQNEVKGVGQTQRVRSFESGEGITRTDEIRVTSSYNGGGLV